ncbi:MAG: ABC transporter permease [Bacteroidota bacterium]
MLKHTIKLAFRSYWRNRSTFMINLIGLSTGLACVLLIYLWVSDEFKVNTFHKNDERLYQVLINYEYPNGIETSNHLPGILAENLKTDLPSIAQATVTNQKSFEPSGVLIHENSNFDIVGRFADEHFFDVFSYDLVAGEAVNNKTSIALAEATANKLFTSPQQAIGQTIEWKNRFFEKTFIIAGVYKNPPANATEQFDAVVHYDHLVDWDEYAADWSGGYAENFVVLASGADVEEMNAQIATYLRSKSNGWQPSTLFLQRYSDQYLHGNYESGVQVGGRITYVRLFSIIALFILLIACVNFMNLSTAQASIKMKEIGVKKTIGANRRSLMMQFLGESMVLITIAVVVALSLVALLFPSFNALASKSLSFTLTPSMIGSLVVIIIGTGLLAGSYPAFYLSGFRPIHVLKGKLTTNESEQWIRKGLVVFQFALSVIFIVGVLVIQQQMDYVQSKHLGYERENVILFQSPSGGDTQQTFLSELKNLSGVQQASNMYWNILSGKDSQGGYSWRGQEEDKGVLFQAPRIGYDVIETLEMELVAGRTFSRDFKDDATKIVINEAAAELMELDDPVGTIIKKGSDRQREIIGVVKNFHYGSIHQQVEPTILRFRSNGRDIMVRLEAGTEQSTIPQIAEVYKELYPDYNFKYRFLDEEYQALYEAESRVATLSQYASGLAIIISCLGLLGLAMFTSERRRKEIGIRKVLGASVTGIVALLSKDFIQLVIIAFLIATPIAYYFMNEWLQDFAYRIELRWWVFALAGLAAIGIALLTVSFQSVRAALANPVKSLRSE